MSWLISLFLTGLMLSPESNAILNTNNIPTNILGVVQTFASDETERFEQNYPFSANGKISVSNVNGAITIEAWDKNEIRLEAVKIADSKERFSEVEIRIDARQDAFSIETKYERNRNWSYKKSGRLEVQYRLNVPRGAILDDIETVNGSVSISDMINTVNASAVNGNVKAVNLRGTTRISTVNGTTEAAFDLLDGANEISLDTVNGRVDLEIPADANATVKADTVNGNITNDFGLPVRKGQYIGRNLYGKIGNGAVKIKLNSVNGELSLRRKNDGKNPNPTVNLLAGQPKDWEGESAANTEKVNSDIAKSMRQAQKEMREAQRKIAAVQPEIDKAVRESMKAVAATLPEINAKISEVRRRATNIDWENSVSRVEKKSKTFQIKGTPNVTVDAKNCSVSVKGWDKSEVQYVVSKFSRNAESVSLKAEQKDSDVKIKIDENDAENSVYPNFPAVRVEIFVPRKSNLRIMTNKEIRLQNVSGEIDLSGVDEAINVRDSEGKLNLKAVDANVRVIGFKGEFSSETVDGTINLEGVFNKIDAKSVDGTIILTLPENADAELISNTEVEAEGLNLTKAGEENWRIGKGTAKYKFDSADGKILVRTMKSL